MSARAEAAPSDPVNEVHLVGRLAAEPRRRQLPSGDVVVTFRLVVARPPSRLTAGRRAASRAASRTATVDTLECAAWRGEVQRRLARAVTGEVLELRGSLRRRFWRDGSAAVSRSEVEVASVRRLTDRVARGSA